MALRLIRRFAVGGEISGAGAMILEHAPFGRRGYFAGFTLQDVQAAVTVFGTRRSPRSRPTASHLNDLGLKHARPVSWDEYDRIRREGMNTTV